MSDQPNPINDAPGLKQAPRAWIIVLAIFLLMSTGCTADITVRGNAVNQDQLTQIQPGIQDRGTVRELLGSPTNIATFGEETWYYITQRDKTVAFSKAKAISRQVVAISFNDAGQVAEIKQYSLADGRKIEPNERQTPTPGQEFSIIEQLLGNLGRFEAPGALDGL